MNLRNARCNDKDNPRYIHFYVLCTSLLLLLHVQYCCHLLEGVVANKMKESLRSKECLREEEIKSEKNKKGTKPGEKFSP